MRNSSIEKCDVKKGETESDGEPAFQPKDPAGVWRQKVKQRSGVSLVYEGRGGRTQSLLCCGLDVLTIPDTHCTQPRLHDVSN